MSSAAGGEVGGPTARRRPRSRPRWSRRRSRPRAVVQSGRRRLLGDKRVEGDAHVAGKSWQCFSCSRPDRSPGAVSCTDPGPVGKAAAVVAGQAKDRRPADPRPRSRKNRRRPARLGRCSSTSWTGRPSQPLPAVTLKVWINGKIAREHITDDSGRMVIRLPAKATRTLDGHGAGVTVCPDEGLPAAPRGEGDRDPPILHAGDGAGHVDRWHRPG